MHTILRPHASAVAASAFSGQSVPVVLSQGVEPSADPMLAARAAPGAVGLGRRLGDGAKQ